MAAVGGISAVCAKEASLPSLASSSSSQAPHMVKATPSSLLVTAP
jgi:hypothetical protein